MATIISAPNRMTAAHKRAATTLFLAGPFADEGPSWRDEVIGACNDLDITIIDPRNDRWQQLGVGTPGGRGAYEWQCAAAYDADVAVVWVPEGSHAPTALMILGYLGAKRSNAKRSSWLVVGGNGWKGLVRLFAQNHRFFALDENLSEVIRNARIQLAEAIATKAAR